MKNKLVIFILLTIIVVIYIIKKAKERKGVYTFKNFPQMESMHLKLKHNHIKIQKEIAELKIEDPVGIYYGDVYSGEKIKKIKEGSGWTFWDNKRKDWYHFPVVYNGKMMDCKSKLPTLYKIVEKNRSKLHSLYVSALKPGGSIDKHNDGDHIKNTLGHKIMTYHYYVDSPTGSSIGVVDREYPQKTGEYFIFDNSKEHWVYNRSKSWRIAIVAKFDV